MTPKSIRPFIIHPDYIMHPASGQILPFIRVVAQISKPTSLAVVVEFDDAMSRRRQEELSWLEFRSWTKFYNKMMGYGYRCDNVNLFKLLQGWYTRLDIPVIISHLPASGWWGQGGIGKLYYVHTNHIIKRSMKFRVLHKGSYAQPFKSWLRA